MTCPLCTADGGLAIVRTPQFRIVRVVEGEEARRFPAFYRLIWTTHVAEFSDLSASDRHLCMDAVTEVERTLRALLAPTKVNLATLGNVVPHLHWHVIARFDWDSHFPSPVWASALRELPVDAASRLRLPLTRVDEALAQSFSSASL